MTVIEIKDLERYLIWTGGFIPSKEEFDSLVLPEYRTDLSKGTFSIDELFLTTLRKLVDERYLSKCEINYECRQTDLYLINISGEENHKGTSNPLEDELRSVDSSRVDYRFTFLLTDDDNTKRWKESYFEALQNLGFRVRDNKEYKNLVKLNKFLQELSDLIVSKYVAPTLDVEKELCLRGFRSNVEAVV